MYYEHRTFTKTGKILGIKCSEVLKWSQGVLV